MNYLLGGESGGDLGFFSRILAVKSRDGVTWTLKSETVNTEETMPSSIYPVTYTMSGNYIIFNNPSVQVFDIQARFSQVMANSEYY